MPPAILLTAGGAALTSAISGATAGATLANIGVSTAAAYYLYKTAPDPNIGEGISQRSGSATEDPVQPARWIVGRHRTAGARVFRDEEPENPLVFWQIFVLSEGPCDRIERVWADGRELDVIRNAGRVIGVGEEEGRIEIWESLDAENGRPPQEFLDAFPSWTEDHRLDGLAWVTVKLTQTPYFESEAVARYWSGLPNLEFLLRGQKISWPGQDEPVWTDNAAAVRYWFLRERRGLPESAIDRAAFDEAFAICDASVQSERRYTINTAIEAGSPVEDLEREFDFAWQGFSVEIDGVAHFLPGAEREPVDTIEVEDLLDEPELHLGPAIQDRINAATMTVQQDIFNDWREATIEAEDSALLARDGRLMVSDMGARFVVGSSRTARRLLSIFLRRARSNRAIGVVLMPTLNADGIPKWLLRKPGELVTVNIPALGISAGRFAISHHEVRTDLAVVMRLEEVAVGTYADTLAIGDPDPRAISGVGARTPPPRPSFAAGSPRARAAIQADGTIRTFIDVSVAASAFPLRVEVSGPDNFRATAQAPGAAVEIDVPGTGAYTVRAFHRSRVGVESEARSAQVSVSWATLAPPAGIVSQIRKFGRDMEIVIQGNTARDIAGVEVAYTSGDVDSLGELPAVGLADWDMALKLPVEPIVPSIAGRPMTARVGFPRTARYRLFLRLVSRQGALSGITDLGPQLVAVEVGDIETHQAHPRWLGQLNDCAVLEDDDAPLVPDPNHIALTKDRWDGQEGWLWGRVRTATISPAYTMRPIDLGALRNVAVALEPAFLIPPGAAVAPDIGRVRLSIGTSVDGITYSENTVQAGVYRQENAVRYLRGKIEFTDGYQGGGLVGFALHRRSV